MVGKGSSMKSRVWELLGISDWPFYIALPRKFICRAVGQSADKGPRGSGAFYVPGSAPQKWNNCFQLQRCKLCIFNQM